MRIPCKVTVRQCARSTLPQAANVPEALFSQAAAISEETGWQSDAPLKTVLDSAQSVKNNLVRCVALPACFLTDSSCLGK